MTPAQAEQIRDFFHEMIPFNKVLGLRIRELDKGSALILIPFRPELVGDPSRPALHGGVLSAAIDAAGGAAAFTMVEIPNDRISTIDLRVDYLRPADLEDLICKAVVTRSGNRVSSVDITAYHDSDPNRLIATGKAVYSIKRG